MNQITAKELTEQISPAKNNKTTENPPRLSRKNSRGNHFMIKPETRGNPKSSKKTSPESNSRQSRIARAAAPDLAHNSLPQSGESAALRIGCHTMKFNLYRERKQREKETREK